MFKPESKCSLNRKQSSLKWSFPVLLFKGLSNIIYIIIFYLVRYRYQLIETNFARAFPSKTKQELKHLVKAYYNHISDLCVEPFLFYIVSPSLRRKLATYSNVDLLSKLHQDQQQIILLASHYGNWEYMIDLPQVVDYQVYTAYTPISNHCLNRFFIKIRSFLGVTLIPKQQFYRKALGLLKESTELKMVVLIADQRPGPGSNKYHLPFLYQDTAVQIGAERMAITTDSTVVFIESNKIGRFQYQYTFGLLAQNASQSSHLDITMKYYDNLEKTIKKSPVFWLWSHNRWKKSD